MSYVLDILPANRDWLAVGVLVDPFDPAGPEQLRRYVEDHGVCGLRIQGRILGMDPVDQEATTPLWQQAADLGIALDINASQPEYDAVARRARQFPSLPIVLDHCGYVSPDLAPVEPQVEPVLRLAEQANVYAKLSFVGAASTRPYPCDDVHWMVRQIVDAFGAERCVYGSNFPTAQYNPTLSYSEATRLFSEAIELSDHEREWVLGRTASRLWRWG
jgi:predicted TIM-barrel fold metal-dependent hydrolase